MGPWRVSADKGMMVAAFDHTNQIKSKRALQYDVKPVVLVQADNSRRAPLDQLVRHMHVSSDEGSYLIPSRILVTSVHSTLLLHPL